VILRQFDGLGLGIKDHDAIIPAVGLAAATAAALPISHRVRPSVGYFDLQIIRSSPQVKTSAGVAFAVLGHISLGFKQLARPLHVATLLRVSCFHDGFGFAAALLAASTVIRISYGSEGWRRVGVDFGRNAADQEDS
jgi:hypothetical protein